jgi:hypothetical protein
VPQAFLDAALFIFLVVKKYDSCANKKKRDDEVDRINVRFLCQKHPRKHDSEHGGHEIVDRNL